VSGSLLKKKKKSERERFQRDFMDGAATKITSQYPGCGITGLAWIRLKS